MTTITVSLSRAAYDTMQAARLKNGIAGASEIVDVFFSASHAFSSAFPSYETASYAGSTLRLNHAGGAYSTYQGVVDRTPNQSTGYGTATSLERYAPDAFRLTSGGSMTVNYASGQFGTNFTSGGGTLTAAAIQTLIPTYSSSYDQIYGNVKIGLQGNISFGTTGLFSGTIHTITQKADKYISTGTINGDFKVSGDAVSIGLNLATTSLSGTLTTALQRYHDGSVWDVTDAAIAVSSNTVIDHTLLANASNFGMDDMISISLPTTIASKWHIAAGAGDDTVTISGGGSLLTVDAGSGNDKIVVKDWMHIVDGGAGHDTVAFDGMLSSSVTVSKIGADFVVRSNGTLSTNQLANVERLSFADGNIALDVSGTAGQAYRIYQAAFGRVPDKSGVGFWLQQMDKGLSLTAVAQAFVTSTEFTQLYGANASNKDIVGKFYMNVLRRPGEQAGIDFWTGVLDSKQSTLADVLAGFSESAENQTLVSAVIGNGFAYTPY